jgi:hypothetical protein
MENLCSLRWKKECEVKEEEKITQNLRPYKCRKESERKRRTLRKAYVL